MWKTISLQLLTTGVAIVSLFLKTTADFGFTVSVVLAVIVVVVSTVSVLLFKEQADESKFLKRNLENIVRSISLNEAISDAIKSIINKQAGALGYPNVKIGAYTGGLTSFAFYRDNNYGHRRALLVLRKEEFNEFALYNPPEINTRVEQVFNSTWPTDSEKSWYLLPDDLHDVAVYVANEHDADLSMFRRIWVDKVRIGIATSQSLAGPDVIFERPDLAQLISMTRIERQNHIARRIEQALLEAHPAPGSVQKS